MPLGVINVSNVFFLQLHFSEKMTTDSPSTDIMKDAGKAKGREDAEKLPWKLPVIIGGPVLIVFSKSFISF